MDTKKLRQKILDLTIRGKLVPQDPNDEPASVLLERIRAEKERLIAEGKIKRPKKSKASSSESHYRNFEPPFPIPDSWEWVRLGEICDVARGGSPRPIKSFLTTQDDGINWIKIGDTDKDGKYISSTKERIIPSGVSKSRLVHKGDFLLTNSMSFGRPYILNIDGCIHDGWLVISPVGNAFDKNFLYLLLSSGYAFNQFRDQASGSAVSNLNSDKVADSFFPLPPIKAQERIVEEYEKLSIFIQELDSNKDNLKLALHLAKSKILDLAMQGKLVPQDPTDEPASDMLLRINPKAKIITDNPHYKVLPKLWILCTLESVANIKSAKRVMKDDWKNDGIPFYRTREIIKLSHDGYVDNQLYISHELYDSYKDKYGVPQTGDIMLTAVGTIGETYIVKKSDQFYYKDASVLCVQPINNLLDSAYFCLFIRSNIAQKQIHNQSKGTTVDTITIEKSNNYTFILPPLKEQKRLVAEVEKLYSILDEIEASLQS